MVAAALERETARKGGTSLDTREQLTTVPESWNKSAQADRLHRAKWEGKQAAERRRLIDALRDGEIPGAPEAHERRQRIARELETCGDTWGTWASASGRGKVTPHHCDQAVCPRCANHRTRKIRHKYEWITTQPQENGEPPIVRMLTLTQAVIEGETWKQARRRLMAAWRRFWRDADTRAHIQGGMRRLETTWSLAGRGWHVHLHIAYTGEYWPQEEIAEVWDRCARTVATLDAPRSFACSAVVKMVEAGRLDLPPGERLNTADQSGRVTLPAGTRYAAFCVVDVRKVWSPVELFKYMIKTAKAPRSKLVEYVDQSAGSRCLELIGSWRKVDVPEEAQPDEIDDPFFQVDDRIIADIADGTIPPFQVPAILGRYPELCQHRPLTAREKERAARGAFKPDRIVAGEPRANLTPLELVAWAKKVHAGISEDMERMIARETRRLFLEVGRMSKRARIRWTVAAP